MVWRSPSRAGRHSLALEGHSATNCSRDRLEPRTQNPEPRTQNSELRTRNRQSSDKYLRLAIHCLIQLDWPPSFEVLVGGRDGKDWRERRRIVNPDAGVFGKIRLNLDPQIVEVGRIDG